MNKILLLGFSIMLLFLSSCDQGLYTKGVQGAGMGAAGGAIIGQIIISSATKWINMIGRNSIMPTRTGRLEKQQPGATLIQEIPIELPHNLHIRNQAILTDPVVGLK